MSINKFFPSKKPREAPRVATKPESEPVTHPDDASTTPKLEERLDISSADRAGVDASPTPKLEERLDIASADRAEVDASPTPNLEEWPDIVSADRANVDISQLSSHKIDDILRLFDLNPSYGPFVGIDRLFRWQRAENWGLEPPLLIKDLIETERSLRRFEGTPRLEEWPDIASADWSEVDASPTPNLEEWPDIASADRANVDVSQLSSHKIEDILRLFDLNPTYGPFVGVGRLFRWQKAEKWGLEPPLLIKDLIETERALPRLEAGSRW